MSKRLVYGVFDGTKAGITTRKDAAIRYQKANPNAEIRVMPAAYYRSVGAWDYPTFRVLSDQFPVKETPANV